MFDWLGDIFSGDTWGTISSGLGSAADFGKQAAPYIQGGLGLMSGFDSMNRSRALSAQQGQTANQLASLFTPDGVYAQELRRQLERRDAAAGRRSQYGTRETELMAALARQQAGTLGSPQYNQYLTGAERSPYGGIMGALGNMFSLKDKNGNFKSPPGTSNALNYLADTFLSTTPDISIAGLGGAESALAGTPEVAGVPDVLGGLAGSDPYLPGYEGQASTTDAGGIFSGYGQSAAGNLAAAEGIGGAGASLAGGMSSGALGGSVGAVDSLGMLGGTGFLPSYGAAGAAEAGATGAGLFAGEAAGAGAGAGAGASGAAAAAPAGMGAAVALPFAIAAMGMLNGIFGRPDGPPSSTRDNANIASGWASSYGDPGMEGSDSALWKQSGAYDWMTPELEQWMKTQPQRQSDLNYMTMDNKYYTNDNPFLAAYMKSQFGDPNSQQVRQGLGGYNSDQYGQAQNYFNMLGNDWERQYGSTQGGAG